MGFLEDLHKNTNTKDTLTANYAVSNSSTLNPVLDLFSNAGAMREGQDAKLKALFAKAYASDKQLTVRCLFYLRDVRGGQGERRTFRVLLNTLEALDRPTYEKVLPFISEYGRWDDLFVNEIDETIVAIVKDQLAQDEANMANNKPVSLLAKWLPSENASNKERATKARKIAQLLDLKPSHYRKKVTALRKYIKLLEQQMSAKEWDKIEYGKLPTQAHRKHIGAFRRHDEDRYEKYLEAVEKGEDKINANTAYTYEVYDMVLHDWERQNERTANAMWNALPDYTHGQNALVLADVSGSMSGRPMSISVSLALYFAERNEGPFKDYFLTFTERSRLQKVEGNTLSEKMNSIQRSDWGMNTNLQSAFDAILEAAKNSNASADEMPSVLYIISDMQFDQATYENDETNFEVAQRKFKEAGYELPHVVFWNCNAWGDDAPATMYDDRVTLISGSSQSTFQYVLSGKTPMESMLDILNSERYDRIRV